MNYNKNIHGFKHLAKNILGRVEFLSGKIWNDKNELVVLNFHGTQKKFIKEFENKIAFLAQHFEFLSPSNIPDYQNRKLKNEKPFVLLTFDDGIKNNLYAAEILNKMQIKALFFVIPGFINENVKDQKLFFKKNIRPIINSNIDSEEEDFTAMSWNDLQKLINSGHTIGSHTITHTLISSKSTPENSITEIAGSKEQIEKMLGIKVNSFCSPNDSLLSVGLKEMQLIKKHYDFHFSTFPGTNINGNSFFIRRSNVEAHWMKGTFINAFGKWDRKRWKNKILLFQKIAAD